MSVILTQNTNFTYNQATCIPVTPNSKAQATEEIPELCKIKFFVEDLSPSFSGSYNKSIEYNILVFSEDVRGFMSSKELDEIAHHLHVQK